MKYNLNFIGDVHGKMNQYLELTKRFKTSYNLGDVGFKNEHLFILNNVDFNNHKTLLGNHDDPSFIHSPHSLGNYGFDGKVYFIRGAWSIDHRQRIEGRDWFREEELNISDFYNIMDEIVEIKPDIIISHDCPKSISKLFWNIDCKSRTSNGLQAIYELYQPKYWLFGHNHKSKNEMIGNTNFICLAELETISL